MHSLGRVSEESPKFNQNFLHISYEFIIITFVWTCKYKSMTYAMNVKHFQGKVYFDLITTPDFWPTMTDSLSEANTFKFDILM